MNTSVLFSVNCLLTFADFSLGLLVFYILICRNSKIYSGYKSFDGYVISLITSLSICDMSFCVALEFSNACYDLYIMLESATTSIKLGFGDSFLTSVSFPEECTCSKDLKTVQ